MSIKKKTRSVLAVISMAADFAALTVYIFTVSPDALGELHPAAITAICAGAAIVVYLLTLIPYIGRVFQISAGALLCRAAFDIADNIGEGALTALKEENFGLWLGIAAAAFAVSLCLHLRKTLGENIGVYIRENAAVPDEYEEYEDESGEAPEESENDGDYAEYDNYEPADISEDDETLINENIRRMAAASDSYKSAMERTRRHFAAISSGEYLISGEQLTVISGIAEEFEQLVGRASDIFIAFDDDGGYTDASPELRATAERMESLEAIMENVVGKLPLAGESLPDTDTEEKLKPESSAYFNGCHTLDDLKKRYKSLSKIFHPDTEMGDTESMQRINDEFERMKKALRRTRKTESGS